MGSIRAELVLLRKRSATWTLVAVTVLMTALLGYLLPYLAYTGSIANDHVTGTGGLASLLPDQLIANTLVAFPFWFGMIGLILGVLTFGAEHNWGTLKTSLLQQPNRLRLVSAKFTSLAVAAFIGVLTVFALAAASSITIALVENATISWPLASDLARGIGAGWLIIALWMAFGAILAVLTRGTALAIGLGLLYGLVLEGLLSGFGQSIAFLDEISVGFLRTNTYSLVEPFGAAITDEGGPGSFSGQLVDPWQAAIVCAAYVTAFAGISEWLLRRRDVT